MRKPARVRHSRRVRHDLQICDEGHVYPFSVEAQKPGLEPNDASVELEGDERWSEEQLEMADVEAEIEADWEREGESADL
jgi:hypothetical protein